MEVENDEFSIKPKSLVVTPQIDKPLTLTSRNIQPSNMGFPSQTLCTTPVLENYDNDLLKQQHTIHMYDSGFADWTPDSISSANSLNQNETPYVSASASFTIGNIAPSSEPSPVLNLSRQHRRSWPLRTRRLSFQSPDTPQATDEKLQKGELAYLDPEATPNKSEIFKSEKELNNMTIQPNTSSQILTRSRSSSRSPLSSFSDELESSFQEMSLEESSCSSGGNSNHHSPSPLVASSSPVFTFKDCRNLEESPQTGHDRKLSQLSSWGNSESNDQTMVLNDDINDNRDGASGQIELLDRKSDVLTSSHSIIYTHRKSKSDSACEGCNSGKNPSNSSINQTDFTSSLSLIPTPISKRPVSLFYQKNVPVATTYLSKPVLDLHNSAMTLDSHHSSTFPSSHCVSPTKRCKLIPEPLHSDSISPLKMRKLKRAQSVNSKSKKDSSSKKELFMPTAKPDIETNPTENILYREQNNIMYENERVPQFLNLFGISLDQTDDSLISPESETVHSCHKTPLSWKVPNTKRGDIFQVEEDDVVDNSSHLVQKICLRFSPANPSQLIGRRIGVKRFDILGELHQQGFVGCVKLILMYIPDHDLIRIPEVCGIWKSVVFSEPKAHRRYKMVCKKITSPKKWNISEKENVVDKLQSRKTVLMTESKGQLTAIQPQRDITEISNVKQILSSPNKKSGLCCDDRVRNCPHCNSRAVILPGQDRATCLSAKCGYDFCTNCFFPFHRSTPCKPLIHSTSKNSLVGSKQSKKNLKRL